MSTSTERDLVAGLSDAERAALPSRLRALVSDSLAKEWSKAKGERDAAIDAVTDSETGLYIDAEAVAAARERWVARKAELLGREG